MPSQLKTMKYLLGHLVPTLYPLVITYAVGHIFTTLYFILKPATTATLPASRCKLYGMRLGKLATNILICYLAGIQLTSCSGANFVTTLQKTGRRMTGIHSSRLIASSFASIYKLGK